MRCTPRSLGLDSLGVASDYHDYSKQLQYDLREIPARTKDFFKTLFKVPSTFVGDPISSISPATSPRADGECQRCVRRARFLR